MTRRNQPIVVPATQGPGKVSRWSSPLRWATCAFAILTLGLCVLVGWSYCQFWQPSQAFSGTSKTVFVFQVECTIVSLAIYLGLRMATNRSRPARVAVGRVLLAVLVSAMLLGSWESVHREQPFRFAFWWSRKQFDVLARDIVAQAPQGPMALQAQVGLFEVTGARIARGAVLLDWDGTGDYGFAYIPQSTAGKLPGAEFGFPEDPVHCVELARIDGDWYVFYNLFRRIRSGWSRHDTPLEVLVAAASARRCAVEGCVVPAGVSFQVPLAVQRNVYGRMRS